jgi:taurine dioxygenase
MLLFPAHRHLVSGSTLRILERQAVGYEIKPISRALGGEVVGLDLKAPLLAADVSTVMRALADKVVLVFRNQNLTAPQLFAAAQQLGEPAAQSLTQYQAPDCPMVSYVSNQERTEEGVPKLLGKAWHTDHSFQAKPPMATMLHAVALPKHGSDTWFANMRLAYDELSSTMKNRLRGLKAVHAYRESREIMTRAERSVELSSEAKGSVNGVLHPVVRHHDENGSKAIYINPLRIKCFIGMGADDSAKLLDALTAHATRDAFIYRHVWRPGDVVLWDNRQALHRVEHNHDLSEKRLMLRVILEGDTPK